MAQERYSQAIQADLEHKFVWDDDVADILVHCTTPWYNLKPGERVPYYTHQWNSLNGTPSSPKTVVEAMNGKLVARTPEQAFVLESTLHEDPDLTLINQTRDGQQRKIGYCHEASTGKDITLRNMFPCAEDTMEEYKALLALSRAGYPVPGNPRARQMYYPWTDTILYDYVPGQSVASALEAFAREGDLQGAMGLLDSFGSQLKTIWQPILEGPLPNGELFCFPDQIMGNWIVDDPGRPALFTRIDVLGLSSPAKEKPVTGRAYIRQLGDEICDYDTIPQEWQAPLARAARIGYAAAPVAKAV